MKTKLAKKWDQYQEFIIDQMKQLDVPGVAIGLIKGDEFLSTGVGVSNVDTPESVNESTIFQIGSITKTFTGIAMMRLIEEGKADLDTKVISILPKFRVADPETSANVTIKHLLTHSAGWTGDFFIDTGIDEDAPRKFVDRMVELEQITPLGAMHSYSNSSFCLLGYIIETITDKSFPQVVNEYILEPLEMNQSCFAHDMRAELNIATGHLNRGDKMVPLELPPVPRAALAGGGLLSNVTDMFKYAHFQLNGDTHNGKHCINDGNRQQMQIPSGVFTPVGQNMGLTWHMRAVGGKDIRFHGGRTPGFNAFFFFSPQDHLAMVLLTNAENGRSLIDLAWNRALKNFLDLDIPEHKPMPVSKETMAEICGRYDLARVCYTDIDIENGTLEAKTTFTGGLPGDVPPPPPFRLAEIDDDQLMSLDGENKGQVFDVIRDESGSIKWLWSGGRLHKRIDH